MGGPGSGAGTQQCSGTVALADAGISMPNLKRACRWASMSVVEQYMEHIHASKAKRVALLNKPQKSIAVAKNSEKYWDEHDGSNYGSSNNSNSDCDDSNKTDQKLPATMKSSKNKQAN
eukprot:3929001-Ditylum_brightwellii.AAC.1